MDQELLRLWQRMDQINIEKIHLKGSLLQIYRMDIYIFSVSDFSKSLMQLLWTIKKIYLIKKDNNKIKLPRTRCSHSGNPTPLFKGVKSSKINEIRGM